MTVIPMQAVAFVRGGRATATDDSWDAETARIVLAPPFGAETLVGLSGFSHVEVVFHFDQVAPDKVVATTRHPRGRAYWPAVGIFAQRGKARPNRIGVSVCRLLSVTDSALMVRGLDAVDGSPVLDIKPVMTGFLPRGEVTEPQWAAEIMKDYW